MGVLGDVIVQSIQDLLQILFSPIRKLIINHGDELLKIIVGTPHPDAVFARPTNDAWPAFYDFHWDTMIPLALGLWGLSVGLVILLETTSHLFSSYHRAKLKRRAFLGLVGILSWWWIVALSLRFTDALTGFLVPDLSRISLFDTLSFTAMGLLGIIIALMTNFILFVLIGLIYFLRHVVLYLFVLLMPILIVLWIPGVGPFTLASEFMKRLAGFFVPFLFMTVPVALLFRLGQLLGSSANLSMGGFGAWLTGLVIPLIAVISPFILIWQAGSLFSMGQRMANHASAQRARNRTAKAVSTSQTGLQAGRNFTRGMRGDAPMMRDGRGSNRSRAHAAGSRFNASSTKLRDRFKRRSREESSSGRMSDPPALPPPRTEDFDALRARTANTTTKSSKDRAVPRDDRPRYIY